MTELLAPCKNFETMQMAISAGCDAVYLATEMFGARAYADNFTLEELENATNYAHLHDVKVYVAMNTIIFENELQLAYDQIDKLAKIHVDAIIVQDLSLLRYIKNKYPNLDVHISTQVGVDDINSIKFLESLGANRIVLSRELSIEKIKELRKQTKVEFEVFVHGALCVSYSGNCLMSGLIGYRSGNRGRCVGSCRKPFTLINNTLKQKSQPLYLLSMKDLRTIEYINDLRFIDSLKIEGRMRDKTYVYNVVSNYKKALLNQAYSLDDLDKTFHRTYTKGYLFNEDIKKITNIKKPNNYGYYIGFISKKTKGTYEITLQKPLNQHDHIRIDNKTNEVNLKILKMYDANFNLINSSKTTCYIKLEENLDINDKVYITSDYQFLNSLNNPKIYKRFPLDIKISGKLNDKLIVEATSNEYKINLTSSFVLEQAINNPITYNDINKQLSRLNDTVYYLSSLEVNIDDNVFIVSSKLNQLRREIVEILNKAKTTRNLVVNDKSLDYSKTKENKSSKISCYCTTKEQYDACLEENIEIIYYENVERRNETKYKTNSDLVLCGGLNSIYYYQNKNKTIVCDFSLNVTNSEMVYILHKNNVDRITLSHELNKQQINDIINSYYEKTSVYPNLEMIVYGRADLLFTKYCILKRLGKCGECKKYSYSIKDNYEEFPLLFSSDCYTTILNSKCLNIIDEVNNIKNINTFRLQFTIENKEQTKKVIRDLKNKLNNTTTTSCFNKDTDTYGHFNKEIL